MGRTFHSGLRTEKQALLQVLLAIWRFHKDAMGENFVNGVINNRPLPEHMSLLEAELAL